MNRFNLSPPITMSWAMKANIGLLMATVLVILVHTYMILQSQQFHDLFIDIAGRQRMLHQKHMKEILLAAQGLPTDYGRTRQVLEQSLGALLHGGPIPLTLDNGEVKNLPPAPTARLQWSLKSQEMLFGKFIQSADAYLGTSPSGQNGPQALQEVLALNERLQALAQEGVVLFRQYGYERFTRQMAWEAFIAIFLLGLWALLARQVVRAKEEAEREVVERQRAQQDLLKSEGRLRAIIESSPDVIVLKDFEGRYLMANEATVKVLGRSIKEVLGKRDDELFEKKSADFIMAFDRKVMDSGIVESVEELLTVNGQDTWFSAIKAPYRDSNGTVQGLVGIVRDITENKKAEIALRESEERLRTIIENSEDMIVLTDRDHRYLLANQAAADRFGQSIDFIRGKTIEEIADPDTAAFISKIDHQVFETKEPVRIEKELIVKGQSKWFSAIKVPYLSFEGEVLGVVGVIRDFTDMKNAEAALRESEQRFRNLVTASKDPIFHVGKDQSILYVSPAAELVFGYAPQEWTREFIPQIVHPSSRAIFESIWEYFEQHGKFSEELMEISWIRKDGTILYTDQQFANLYDEHGAVSGFLVIARDITKRKKSEEALRESEERFRKLVAASKDPIFFIGTHGELIYGSPAVETVFGYALSDWTKEKVVHFLHPTSMPTFERFWQYFEDHGKFPEDSLEITWIKKDGTLLHSEQRYSNVYDQEGKISGFLTISRDITERKRADEAFRQSEERFRTLVTLSTDPIFYVGIDQSIIYVSPSVEQVFGYAPHEWNKETAPKLVHPSFRNVFENHWDFYHRHGYFEEGAIQLVWVRKDGTNLYTDQQITNIYDKEGKVSGFLTIVKDLTDRKLAEEALRKSREEIIDALRQSDAMKSAVLSSISHEIRTPLAAIKAMVYSGPEGDNESTALIRSEFLDGINQEIDYLNRMVDNLLDMSRLESGKVIPTREWFLIEDLIEGAIRRVGKSIEQRELELVLAEALPPLFVDGIEIQQVLVNLLDNAVKYSREHSLIRLEVIHDRSMVEIRIFNQGERIPEWEWKRVFERFYRSSSPATRRTRGTGLGLAICKGIVEGHRGKIWIDSDSIQGVKVTVQLPVEQSPSKQYSLT